MYDLKEYKILNVLYIFEHKQLTQNEKKNYISLCY